MSLLNGHEETQARGGHWKLILLICVIVAAAGYFVSSPGDRGAHAAPAATPVTPAEEAGAPEERSRRAAAPEREPAPVPPAPAPPPPPAIVLRVTSDVEGADVFIDRRYVGTTPFESHDLTPGRYRVHVSAPTYESHVEDVELTDELTILSVTFQQVRLNQSVRVVHKHRFGDCEGQLIAGTDGIRYQTSHDDSFTVTLGALEDFAIDYLEHNLRIKQRGGRTYNFTDREDNADALFVFHREVEKVRERLARGDQPGK